MAITYRCPGKDKLGKEHTITLRDDLFVFKDKDFVLTSVLYLDNDESGSLQFTIDKKEKVIVTLEQIDSYVENRGYGTLMMKSLFLLLRQLGIGSFNVMTKIDGSGGASKIKNRIDFYESFGSLPFEEFDKIIITEFCDNYVEKNKVKNKYDARCVYYYVK